MKIWNLAFSITNQCNLRCRHCYASSGIPYEDELTLEEIRKYILSEKERLDIRFITLTGGEAFCRPDIFEVLQAVKNAGIRVSIATNGLLLDEEKIEQLAQIGVDRVQISLEGPGKVLNDAIRGKGTFERIVEVVIPELKARGIFTAISMTPTYLNDICLEEMVQLCLNLKIDTLSVRRFVSEGRGRKNQLETSGERNRKLLEEICRLRRKYKGQIQISTGDPLYALADEKKDQMLNKKVIGGCTAGITSLAIDAHGNIKPCTRMNVILGNIRQDSLSRVWMSDAILNQLRNRELLEGRCGNCKYKMLCGGCRASAYVETGYILGPDKNCWYEERENLYDTLVRYTREINFDVERVIVWVDRNCRKDQGISLLFKLGTSYIKEYPEMGKCIRTAILRLQEKGEDISVYEQLEMAMGYEKILEYEQAISCYEKCSECIASSGLKTAMNGMIYRVKAKADIEKRHFWYQKSEKAFECAAQEEQVEWRKGKWYEAAKEMRKCQD